MTTNTDARAEMVARYRSISELLPDDWQEGYVHANGIRQHYYRTGSDRTGGDKPPLVLLHGFGEGALSWLGTARTLSAEYDLIMPDARGHGLSERAGDDWYAHLLDDAAGLIRSVVGGATYLLGFSQGGATGIFVADRYPELVSALVVTGWSDRSEMPATTADLAQNEGYLAWYRGYLGWLEGLKSQSHAERMIASLAQLRPGAPLPPEDEYVAWVEDAARLDLQMIRGSLKLWSGLAEGLQALTEAVARLTRPTLLIKSGSWPTPGAEVRLVEEPSPWPQVRTVRFTHAGHTVHRDQLQAFIELTRQFLKAH